LRDERTAFASGVPSGERIRYERPDSDRGNWPPTYSLYFFRTGVRAWASDAAGARVTARFLVVAILLRLRSFEQHRVSGPAVCHRSVLGQRRQKEQAARVQLAGPGAP